MHFILLQTWFTCISNATLCLAELLIHLLQSQNDLFWQLFIRWKKTHLAGSLMTSWWPASLGIKWTLKGNNFLLKSKSRTSLTRETKHSEFSSLQVYPFSLNWATFGIFSFIFLKFQQWVLYVRMEDNFKSCGILLSSRKWLSYPFLRWKRVPSTCFKYRKYLTRTFSAHWFW